MADFTFLPLVTPKPCIQCKKPSNTGGKICDLTTRKTMNRAICSEDCFQKLYQNPDLNIVTVGEMQEIIDQEKKQNQPHTRTVVTFENVVVDQKKDGDEGSEEDTDIDSADKVDDEVDDQTNENENDDEDVVSENEDEQNDVERKENEQDDNNSSTSSQEEDIPSTKTIVETPTTTTTTSTTTVVETEKTSTLDESTSSPPPMSPITPTSSIPETTTQNPVVIIVTTPTTSPATPPVVDTTPSTQESSTITKTTPPILPPNEATEAAKNLSKKIGCATCGGKNKNGVVATTVPADEMTPKNVATTGTTTTTSTTTTTTSTTVSPSTSSSSSSSTNPTSEKTATAANTETTKTTSTTNSTVANNTANLSKTSDAKTREIEQLKARIKSLESLQKTSSNIVKKTTGKNKNHIGVEMEKSPTTETAPAATVVSVDNSEPSTASTTSTTNQEETEAVEKVEIDYGKNIDTDFIDYEKSSNNDAQMIRKTGSLFKGIFSLFVDYEKALKGNTSQGVSKEYDENNILKQTETLKLAIPEFSTKLSEKLKKTLNSNHITMITSVFEKLFSNLILTVTRHHNIETDLTSFKELLQEFFWVDAQFGEKKFQVLIFNDVKYANWNKKNVKAGIENSEKTKRLDQFYQTLKNLYTSLEELKSLLQMLDRNQISDSLKHLVNVSEFLLYKFIEFLYENDSAVIKAKEFETTITETAKIFGTSFAVMSLKLSSVNLM